mgnify:FL=1
MSAIKHLVLNPSASIHAGDRSWQRDIPWETFKHVAMNGTSSPSKNDPSKLITEHRDPNNRDHVIKVVTDNPATKIITVIRDTSRPFSNVLLSQKQNADKAHAELSLIHI